MNEEKILWQSKTIKSQILVRLILNILAISFMTAMFSALVAGMLQISEGKYNSVFFFIPALAIIIFFVSKYFYSVTAGLTAQYTITKNGIHYNWGLLKKRQAIITIENIKKVTLVNFKGKSYSSLYIETKEPTNGLSIDFITGKKRYNPTLEKVNNGKEALLLIEKLMLAESH